MDIDRYFFGFGGKKLKHFIKIFLSITFAFVLLFCSEINTEAAAGGTCGSNAKWSFSEGVLTIYGSGRMSDLSGSGFPWSAYADSVEKIIIEEGITYIGSYAFYEMATVTEVSISRTVKEIGSYAFCWCEGLLSVDIPESVEVIGEGAFWCCLDLEEVVFHEGLKKIEDEAFTFCRLITELDFPESLESIGYWAFGDCSDLTYVDMPGVKSLGESVFSGCTALETVKIYDGLKELKGSVFAYCYALKNITVPGSVEYIGDTAFYLCEVLGTVKFTGSVPTISESAFLNASAKIMYPECNEEWEYVAGENFGGNLIWERYSVEGHTYADSVVDATCLYWGYTKHTCTDCGEYYMDNYFSALGHSWDAGTVSGSKTTYRCTRCGEYRYEYSVSGSCGSNARWTLDTEEGILHITGTGSISGSSFKSYKNSIRHVVIDSGITSINAETFFEFEAIETIEIPKTVSYIGAQAFVWCRNLREVIIPEGVTAIYDSTFWGCESLENLVLPSTLKSIGEDVFYRCDSLKTLNIPDSVTSIASMAFWDCGGIEEITIPKGVTALNDDVFNGCSNLRKVNFHDKVETIGMDAFSYCSNLQYLNLPDSLWSIGETAFYGCSSLKEIIIPGSVEYLGYGVFMGCSNLKSIKFTGNPPAFDENAFKNISSTAYYASRNAAWTSSLRKNYGGYITWKTFSKTGHVYSGTEKAPTCTRWGYTKYSCIDCEEYYMDNYLSALGHNWNEGRVSGNTTIFTCLRCSEIKVVYEVGGYCGSNVRWSLNTEEGVLRIYGTGSMNNYGKDSAPWNSYRDSISKVVIESGVTSVGGYAFYEYSTIETVELPSTIRSIGYGAFVWCESLKEIHIPEGVTSLPENCFWACLSMEKITVPNTVVSIGDGAFYSTKITTVNLPEGLTSLGKQAFWSCSKLTSIKIPTTLTVLRESVFSSCSSLKNVTLHDGITEIQRSAFSGCSSISSLLIPKSLKKIGQSAFSGIKLTTYQFSEKLEVIDGYAFGGYAKEIRFLGKAPKLDAKTFEGLKLTVYYPEQSSSWDSTILKNYGGTITWIGESCTHPSYTEIIIEPTCTEGGYIENICSVCGYGYSEQYAEPTGHNLGEWYVLIEPENGNPGEERRECMYCGYYETRKISEGGFVFGDINLDGNVDVMDVYMARLIAAKLVVPDESQLVVGDVDGDGKITAVDANYIRKYAARIIPELPVAP